MKQYLELVNTILKTGSLQSNRTGVKTWRIPGAMLRFDLQVGFPAVTTKKLAFKTAMGELVGFLRGYHNAADFRALGCRVWDQNANENAAWRNNPYRSGEDDLGPIYGVQWRAWPAYQYIDVTHRQCIENAQQRGFRVVSVVKEASQSKVLLYKAIDQLKDCLYSIHHQPESRRILFHAWNCADVDAMALPPCHLLYHFLPDILTRQISLCLYVRSNDMGLGAPFNIAQGAALLHLMGRLSGYTPKWFTYFIGDAHIYENHIEMLREQCTRKPYALPKLVLSERMPDFSVTDKIAPEWLENVAPEDFHLENYQHHAPLTAAMAV